MEHVAPEGRCPRCDCVLTVQLHRERPLQSLGERQLLVWKDRRCSSPECSDKPTVYRSPEGTTLLLPRCEFGLDIVFFIGQARQISAMSFSQIWKDLTQKHGVVISERHVQNLFRLYLALVRCRTVQDGVVQARLREQGKLLLSGDAVRFDDVTSRVYVIREILSGEILAAARIEKASKEALVELLKPIRDLGLPVEATLCDKEEALLGAFESVFPGVPHQVCQTHFLMNLVKPMESEVADLARAVKDVVKEVRQVATGLAQAQVAAPAERELAEEICKAVDAVGRSHSGDKLFEPPPLRRFLRLSEMAEETRIALVRKGGTWPLLESLLVALAALLEWGELARRLERQFKTVRDVARILASDGTSTQVQAKLKEFLDRLVAEAPRRGRGAARGRFHLHVSKVSSRFWPFLFHCYDLPDLPRTNNALEQFFNAVKQHSRRVHGRRSTSGGPLESLAPLLLELWTHLGEEEPMLAELLHGLDPKRLAEARAELEGLAGPARERRSILRKPKAHLSRALNQFLDP